LIPDILWGVEAMQLVAVKRLNALGRDLFEPVGKLSASVPKKGMKRGEGV